MTPSKIQMGLLAQGGKNWIAGRIYCHNLIRACHSLPEDERLDLCLIEDDASDFENHKELGLALPRIETFTNAEDFHKRFQLRNFMSHLKAASWPRHFNAAVRKAEVSVIFPTLWSLGKDFPISWVGWIPDFQHKRLPEFFSEEECQRRDESFQKIVDDASYVVVSSQDAYKDLMKWFPRNDNRVGVLPFASVFDDEVFQNDTNAVIKKYNLPEKFLMFPAQFWKHKNHRVIFEAMAVLKEQSGEDVVLVSTGNTHDYRFPEHFNELQNFLKDHHIQDNVHILGLIPRDEQLQICRAAAVIIQPSFFEGWSSLVEDCRALGKRVILSDIPIHREQNPPQAQFFDPYQKDSLAEILKVDWPNLQAGPILEDEQNAIKEAKENTKQFGRNFIKIIRACCQLEENSKT